MNTEKLIEKHLFGKKPEKWDDEFDRIKHLSVNDVRAMLDEHAECVLSDVRQCGDVLNHNIASQEIGDFIIFTSSKGTAKGGYTLNKAYRVLDKFINGRYYDLQIKNDRGQLWNVSTRNHYKRWSCA